MHREKLPLATEKYIFLKLLNVRELIKNDLIRVSPGDNSIELSPGIIGKLCGREIAALIPTMARKGERVPWVCWKILPRQYKGIPFLLEKLRSSSAQCLAFVNYFGVLMNSVKIMY